VRAIQRTLENAGLDIHALTVGVNNGAKFTEADAHEIYQAGVKDGRRAAEAERGFHDINDAGPPWHEIACECAKHLDRLRENEKTFVEDIVRWTVHGGQPTEKQAKWLRSIYVRVRR
jgi:hypothetical protein